MVGKKFVPSTQSDAISLNAATTGTGTAISFHDCRQVDWLVVGAGTISGGTIVIECAAAADYAGTWFELDSITASSLTGGAATGGTYPDPPGGFVRARVSFNVTGGGSVTVYLNGLLQ